MSKSRRGVRSGHRPKPVSNVMHRSENEVPPDEDVPPHIEDPADLDHLPVTYQALSDYYAQLVRVNPPGGLNLFPLRQETYKRIRLVTGRPLICYVTKTSGLSQGTPAYIDDSDLVGFNDLIYSVDGDDVDILLVSNGGSAETSERIVRLLRERFTTIRFFVPANAFSAATLICFSGDTILMDSLGTLGPIDPQLNGIPARAILRAFETIEGRLKDEGPRALTAYMPLLSKYDLHLLEICKSAEELSKELASRWLSTYMLKCPVSDSLVTEIVRFFSDYDVHKSHGRSIGRAKALELGLNITKMEDTENLSDLVRSLYNQYVLFFEQTPFYKLFESGNGVNWGRQAPSIMVQLPFTMPQGPSQQIPAGSLSHSN